MTTITLEVSDELAARLAPLRDQLPKLLSIALDLADLEYLPQDDIHTKLVRARRLVALAEARAIGEQISASQAERGVQDVDSVTLLNELREVRDRDL